MNPSISILDVGHGNSIVISGSSISVIDAGPGSALLEFLNSEGVKEIDLMLISHADADHISGLLAVLSAKQQAVKAVFLNCDAGKETKIWSDLLFELDEQEKTGALKFKVGISEGEKFPNDPFVIETLAPSSYLTAKGVGGKDKDNSRISSNSLSAVFRVDFNGSPVVLCAGDVDSIGLKSIKERGVNISAPYLVFPHHGGSPGGANIADYVNDIANLVNPERVIFSIGRGKFANPKPELMKALLGGRSQVTIACTQLSENCSDIEIKKRDSLSAKYSRGASAGSCCSGTIVLEIEGDLVCATPSAEDHKKFIDDNISNALCVTCRS